MRKYAATVWSVRAGAARLPAGPVERLVALYFSGFEVVGLEPWSVGVAVGVGSLPGLGGAWVAVSRELGERWTEQCSRPSPT